MSAMLLVASVVTTARIGLGEGPDVYTVVEMFGTSIGVMVAVMAMHLKLLYIDDKLRSESTQRW